MERNLLWNLAQRNIIHLGILYRGTINLEMLFRGISFTFTYFVQGYNIH